MELPESCALPIAERPQRMADFAGFFTGAVRGTERTAPTRLRLDLEPSPPTAARAAGLAAAETSCCSFFTFILTVTAGRLTLEVTVPVQHIAVLDALASARNLPPLAPCPGLARPGNGPCLLASGPSWGNVGVILC